MMMSILTESANTFSAKSTAFQICKDLGITSPDEIVLEDIAMARGVFVREGNLQGAEARLIRQGKKGLIRVRENIPEIGRKRFAIAHELGHWELHPETSQADLYSDTSVTGYWGSNEEIEANTFASELLMPSYLFRPRIQEITPNLQDMNSLSEEFNTTLTSAIIRFIEDTEHSCAVVFSQNGHVKWWKRSENCNEIWFERRQEISKHSLAWNCQNDKEVPLEGERVESYVWLNERFTDEVDRLFEQSIKLGSYETVLTLLWID